MVCFVCLLALYCCCGLVACFVVRVSLCLLVLFLAGLLICLFACLPACFLAFVLVGLLASLLLCSLDCLLVCLYVFVLLGLFACSSCRLHACLLSRLLVRSPRSRVPVVRLFYLYELVRLSLLPCHRSKQDLPFERLGSFIRRASDRNIGNGAGTVVGACIQNIQWGSPNKAV